MTVAHSLPFRLRQSGARIGRGYQRGVAAAVPSAVIASFVAVLSGWPSPLEATAEQLMQWTPLSVANFLLDHLGSFSRPAALLGALAIAMCAGGVAGALAELPGDAMYSRLLGLALAAPFLAAIMLVLFVPSQSGPELIFIATILVIFATTPALSAKLSHRRSFLLRGSTILGGAIVLLSLFSVRPLFRALAARRLFTYTPPQGIRLAGISSLVTPSSKFYIMDKVLQYPEVGPPGWRLSIEGEVARPLTLDYGSLMARPQLNRYVTMECVDNPVGGELIGNALWTGIRVEDLLNEAGARGGTIVFHSADRYAESAPRSLLVESGAMIAFAMNGEVLPRAHGYPARLLLPGIYGFKSVRWLERIQVTHGRDDGDWKAHGWTTKAVIHTATRIDVARRQGDEVLLAGIAFAGTRGIRRVEVRVNGGAWLPTTHEHALSHATWVQWATRLRGQGPAFFEVRAIDGDGMVQIGKAHDAYPDGSSGWATATV
ncbi:MAG: molybdopterin-dependent oxidoreductase [Chloroflexota bacterium]